MLDDWLRLLYLLGEPLTALPSTVNPTAKAGRRMGGRGNGEPPPTVFSRQVPLASTGDRGRGRYRAGTGTGSGFLSSPGVVGSRLTHTPDPNKHTGAQRHPPGGRHHLQRVWLREAGAGVRAQVASYWVSLTRGLPVHACPERFL